MTEWLINIFLAAGSFQMLPVNAWFGATTVASYKTLDDEEAEEEFSR